ncbi:MAG: hypothetical protein GTO29_15165 [Candidatus Latescibacteria bacterium]|nr:hypothetical protein [Candidatus Latescibacterota bacterium]NIO57494.1 hypothetical protein [Candidatus Latescibacterota bacterium]
MKYKGKLFRASKEATGDLNAKVGKIPQQLKSLFVLFLVLISLFFLLRHFFTPDTFGKYGHYRAAAIDSIMSQPLRYAGAQLCMECHDDIYALKIESYHRDVSCEGCHGPAIAHTEDPSEFVPPAPRERGYCPLCHEYNPSRPTGFPQIDLTSHNPPKPCIDCHDPHDPKPPHTPEQCSACHAEIYRTKAVSHHAPLLCTRCHEAPEAHKDQPRMHLPSKPTSRTFCGECHAMEADSPKDIPRIMMSDHGIGYVCWQCHYPHYPEVR